MKSHTYLATSQLLVGSAIYPQNRYLRKHMVKASSQIEKELGLLQQRTEDMAGALDPLYGGYLKALGEASKQQLMAAVYHLCTQAYPDKFLSLSWQQRNQLQKSLQVLASQIHTQLIEQRSQVKKNSRKPQQNNGLAFLQKLLEARSSGTVIHTKEGSSDDLLDKLSEIARFESANRKQQDDANPRKTRSETGNAAELEDWEKDIPPTEDSEFSPSDFNQIDHERLDNEEADTLDTEDLKTSGLETVDLDGSLEELDELGTADFESFSLDADARESAGRASSENNGGLHSEEPEETNNQDTDSEGLDFEMEVPAAEQRLTISEEDDLLNALEALARRSDQDEEEDEDKPLAPVHLMKQQMLMDKAIQDVFKTVSEEANSLLQEASVMPKFPKALMAAAADSRGLGEPLNAVPNVVKVSVRVMHGTANFDMDDEDDGEDRHDEREEENQRPTRRPGPPRWQDSAKGGSQGGRRSSAREGRGRGESDRYERAGSRDRNPAESPRRHREGPPRQFIPADAVEIDAFPEFAVINLQLSEVEFTDPRVSVWRTRLRKELSNLKQLGLRYRKTQRSLETAQAEDAWRSSWTGVEES